MAGEGWAGLEFANITERGGIICNLPLPSSQTSPDQNLQPPDRAKRERVYRAETVIVLVGLRIYFSSEICYEIIIIKIADVL